MSASSTNETELSGWGRFPRGSGRLVQPETTAELSRMLDPSSAIARGLGRSYGEPAVNSGGQVVSMRRLDRFVHFDAATGTLVCEGGVSLARIIDAFGPRGFFPMITPGTKFVTVGGCIANDIHGKGHHAQGSFANCVDAMKLCLADGSIVNASREENADLFWACFGGMGLLGVIVEASIRLRPIATTFYTQRAIRVGNLDEMIDAFDETNAVYPYSVAYIDPTAKGASLGRGVLTVGDHAKVEDLPPRHARDPLRISGGPVLKVPFELPSLTLNPVTIRAVNLVIKTVLSQAGALAHYEKFFYPLDAIGEWNLGYGRRGFTQYQFVVPLADGRQVMKGLLGAIVSSGSLPFLNILKRMGPSSEGPLSFPFEGYTFAIDFPIRDSTEALTRRLDAMVLEAGGRIYLGKDAFLEGPMFRAMYPRVAEFLRVKERWDPRGVFTSDLGRRVGLSR